MGMVITGSDMQRSADHRPAGAQRASHVVIGHDAGATSPGADLVIRTAAVHDDNPEIAAAHAGGHPRLRAGAVLGRS